MAGDCPRQVPRIEAMTAAHAEQVLAIYQAGIDEGNATFEISAPDWPTFDSSRLPGHRFVATAPEAVMPEARRANIVPEARRANTVPGARRANTVLGWVAACAVSDRCVYSGVVEHSVYVHPEARGRGIGRQLLEALIASTEAAGIWTIQSGIFPENEASIAMHKAVGFRIVGLRERLGQHHGRWRDVVLLERRSPAS